MDATVVGIVPESIYDGTTAHDNIVTVTATPVVSDHDDGNVSAAGTEGDKSLVHRLTELKEAKGAGLLRREEYDNMRAKLLASYGNEIPSIPTTQHQSQAVSTDRSDRSEVAPLRNLSMINTKEDRMEDKMGQAIADGDAETVQKLIESGHSVNSRNWDQDTPLIYAAWCGHANAARVLEVLLRHGADVEMANSHGYTALMFCAGGSSRAKSSLQSVKVCLRYGANINRRVIITRGRLKEKTGMTAVHFAALRRSHDSKAILEFLLDAGGDMEAMDDMGNTPLQYAYEAGSNEHISLLLARGAASGSK